MDLLRQNVWSPYLAGIIIGLLQIPAFLLVDTALGASSSFVTGTGFIFSLFDSSITEIKYFAKYMSKDKYFWQSALVIGIALGALISYKASGRKASFSSASWKTIGASSAPVVRLLQGFIGGFVLLVGARIAGGCTSGHGISGLAQLSVGSSVAVAAMFAGGIVTANLLYKRAS
ncbi:putative inner membrane protein [Pseudovibrio sp. W64]|uniref:YeeE/YedE thiosulfate transporter family protein n=1 Tax=Pseudovibrio sp. W64 TaxID=1735583 RepID=UPI0007AE9CEB|nr:YeeE/YedE thiosulfate transporter family protein [Pseudovibrio sp. W64]KZK83721.1 putative inner membrane protein [Pseudovibrio sp. W64]